MRRAPRQEQVIKIKESNPDKSGVEIAHELGISRQRVSQILLKCGYPRPRHRKPVKYCARCGKEIVNAKGYFCLACYNNDLHRRSTISLRCAYCGKEFTRTRGYINAAFKKDQKHFFCGYSCWAKKIWAKRKGIKAATESYSA